MTEKPIDWRGSALRDIKNDDIFSPNARREAGHQLSQGTTSKQDKDVAIARYKAVIRERSEK
jgi:phage-related protein